MITFYYALLAVLTLVTGFFISSLPALSVSIVPWLVLLVITALYSWAMLLVLRKRGEDGAKLWVLHWVPFVLVVLWAILQLLGGIGPIFANTSAWYSSLWTLPGVLLAYIVYALFGLNSGDRMPLRMLLLVLSIIPFVGLGIFNNSNTQQELAMANSLWNNASHRTMQASVVEINVPQNGGSSASSTSARSAESSASSQSSIDNKLTTRLANLLKKEENTAKPTPNTATPTVTPTVPSTPNTLPPPNLAHSGPGLNMLLLVLIIGYVATLHSRAVRRVG